MSKQAIDSMQKGGDTSACSLITWSPCCASPYYVPQYIHVTLSNHPYLHHNFEIRKKLRNYELEKLERLESKMKLIIISLFSAYVGVNCQAINPHPCIPQPCMHGGTCVEIDTDPRGYICICMESEL